MNTQTSLSDKIERVICTLIKSDRFVVTNNCIDCYHIKRCYDCPLQSKDCTELRDIHVHKHPELFI